MDLIIYGAQGMALGAYEAIHYLFPEKNIIGFMVTERDNNPDYLSGVKVYTLNELSHKIPVQEKKLINVLIATPETYMDEIKKSLKENGVDNYFCLSSLKWAELMEQYYCKCNSFIPLSSLPIENGKPEVNMYMAKFYKDKKLNNEYSIQPWITPIQVGAELCNDRVADVLDSTGDNISKKNVNYCELTALYWVWKNCIIPRLSDNSDVYYGLCHYRRILNISEDDIGRLVRNNIDVVLPYPMPYEPNIEVHHNKYIKKEDWKALLKAINELYPEYAKVLPSILQQRYLYNYNIILARDTVLSEYCEWLFSILQRVEELSNPKGSERCDRYIGYMGETLETLFFMVNKDRLNIAHTGCRFLL